ncbi:hypothetical protein [Nocardia salmonicida]|uniref:hypothetical protein n=1 Tax=Nocardia salmonicida TaxID=53431 RepID=UPI0007A40E4F|nr:hypothetical protein [Nocardia salmonicida]MBC7299458.1 hypothetical protein [Nocardia sp.]
MEDLDAWCEKHRETVGEFDRFEARERVKLALVESLLYDRNGPENNILVRMTEQNEERDADIDSQARKLFSGEQPT